MPYPLGGVVPLDVSITDANGSPIDPVTLVCSITRPDDVVVTPTPASTETGKWTVDYTPTMAGLHQVLWSATGPSLALPDVIDVRPAAPGFIVSVRDAKKKCKIPMSSTDKDDKIRGYIESVTTAIEDHVHQAVVRRTVVEDIYVDWAHEVVLSVVPVLALVSVATVDASQTYSTAELHVDRDTGVVSCLPGGQVLNGLIRFTTKAGFLVPPSNYVDAALIVIEHLWLTERTSTNSGPAPGGYQDSTDVTFTGSFGYAIPNRALELLGKPPVMGG